MGEYQIINKYDMQGRFMGVQFYNNGIKEQVNSHGFSYLDSRMILAKGEKIGLETLPEDMLQTNFEKYGKIDFKLERILKILKN